MQHFVAPDGAKIAYRDEGRGQPLLLLHGLMAHGGFFAFQRPLATGFRLISLDLRGHGASPAPTETLSVERLAGDIISFVETLDLQGAIGVGWSLGATVLWHVLAGRAADRFAGSVIVDMTPRVLNGGDWQLGLSHETCEARRVAIRDDFRAFALGAGQAIFAQPLDERTRDIAGWAGEEFARNDPAAMGALWASLVEQDARPLLAGMALPTLVVRGAQSQLYGPGTADYLAATLPDAAAIQFDRSGHAPHMEQPELFNTSIREFAAGLPRIRETQAML